MWRDSRTNAALLLAAVAFLMPAAGLAVRQTEHNATYLLTDRFIVSTELDRPPLVALNVETADGRRLQAQLEQQLHQLWSFRSQQAAASTTSWSRRLLADQTFRVAYSSASAVCPSSSSADWAAIPGYGHLVSDNWVCSNTNTSRRLHGGSAQDFGSSRPNWASYGWAAFAIPAAPAGSPLTKARVEGLNLLVLGNQGLGGVGNCSIDAVDIAIYSNSNGAPSSKIHSVALQLPGDVGNSQTFTWNSNVSSVLSFDIVDRHSVGTSADPPALLLDYGAAYWLRVQLAANYRGNTGTAKCIVNWVLNNATKTGYNSLWQETVGGAAGYSTTCTGAATGALPPANQTFASCFNGAVPGSTSSRRCLTYRNTASNPISCPAQFLDYSFAFYGNNAVSCPSAPSLPLSNGSWPSSCAGTLVGQSCSANCTWGGAASTVCLVTGEWSASVTGQCADPPTNCSGNPTAALTNGTWPGGCADKLIGDTCTASCQFGGSATVTCEYGGTWSPTSTGTCNAPPTNCTGVPTATLSNGSWPSSCAGTLVGQSCSANCTWGGSASTVCLATGAWDTSFTGQCADPPTNCTAVPTATLTSGTWPAACAQRLVGQTCSATCSIGGSASVTCLPTGQWEATATGSCTAGPTNCSSTPSTKPDYGSWPASCDQTLVGSSCQATCTYGGTVTSLCKTDGTWASASGSCTPGATAFISDSGLGSSDKLWTCTLTGGTFSSCTSTADNTFNAVRGTFSDGSTVWAADAAGSGGGDIYACSVNAQTNVLSGCTAITSWGSYSGARAPSGIVVKSGVAFIANDVASGGSNCPVLQCTTATATSIGGCTCLSATAGILSGADGIAISPDGSKLYATGTVQTFLTSNTPGIAVCTLTGTTIGSCNTYTFSSYVSRSLTGLYANGTHVFTFASGTLGSKALICDGTAPAESSCADGITISSSLLSSNTGPWGMSQFDGLYYVPDGDKFQKCSDVSGTGTCGSPLTLVGLLSGLTNLNAGINSIFVYPRI